MNTMPEVMKTWKPTPNDIAWAQNLVRLGKPKFTWTFPHAGTVYDIDKTNKTITLKSGPIDEYHWKTKIVFEKIGYTMTGSSEIAMAE